MKFKYVLILTILPTVLFSVIPFETTYRGYSTIDYIGVIVIKNDIITEKEVQTIVKSIGINTLPNNIYFDEKLFIANHTMEESWELSFKPNMFIAINAIRNKTDPNKYSGHIEVNLEGNSISSFIKVRPTDKFIDSSDLSLQKKEEWKKKWSKKSASYDIIIRGQVFTYSTKSQIKNKLREYVQEIFDELNILIRDYP